MAQIVNALREAGAEQAKQVEPTKPKSEAQLEARSAPEYGIRKEAGKNGLTDFAISLGLKKLSSKQFIAHEVSPPDEQWGDPYLAYSPTEIGWQWLQNNEDQFVLQRSPTNVRKDLDLDKEPDDIPF
jgi:hypothetical protein